MGRHDFKPWIICDHGIRVSGSRREPVYPHLLLMKSSNHLFMSGPVLFVFALPFFNNDFIMHLIG